MHVEDRSGDPRRDAFLHMQTSSPSPWSGRAAAAARPGPSEHADPNPNTRSLRGPGGRRHSRSPPPPFRSCSIPIIPSVQCHHDNNEASCMQTGVAPAPCKEARSERAARDASASSSCSSTAAGQQRQDEVALLLLEEAQEQLRALAATHRKQEEGGVGGSGGSVAALLEVRETVCFLNLNGGSAGALSCSGPTQTQLLSPSLAHRDLGQSSQ